MSHLFQNIALHRFQSLFKLRIHQYFKSNQYACLKLLSIETNYLL
jgi:hypothetical protein